MENKPTIIFGRKRFSEWACNILCRIENKLDMLTEKENHTMATLDELNAKMDAIPPILDAITQDEQALKDQIQALKDQIATGTPVSQAQLDELSAKADGILGRLQSIDASVP